MITRFLPNITRFIGCCIVYCTTGIGYQALSQVPAIGQWRDHLPYHRAIGLANAGYLVYCATPYSVFAVNTSDNSMDRYSKTNGLSETGVSAIGYDPSSAKLVIAYTSSSVDILHDGRTVNIPDIKRSGVLAGKRIYQVFIYNGIVYLSTSLGLILLDEDKYEVKDTYVIGAGGDSVAVYALTVDDNAFYAATSRGLSTAPLASSDLADYHNWSLISGPNGLGDGPCRQVVNLAGRILVVKNDSIFLQDNGSWTFFYTDGRTINDLSVSGGKLLLCGQRADSGLVTVLNSAGAVEKILGAGGELHDPRQAFLSAEQVWVADSVNGLSSWPLSGTPEYYIPNSPLSLATGAMTIAPASSNAASSGGGTLWVASGGTDSNRAPLNNHDGIYRLDGEGWTNYNGNTYPIFDSVFDFVTIAGNPRDSSIWAGSFGEGLLQRRPGDQFTWYGAHSPIGPAVGSTSVYRVTGAAFDKEGNGWFANDGARKELLLRRADGSWHSFSIPFSYSGHAVGQIVLDDYNQVWIQSPAGNGVFCYNPGTSLEDPGDDQWKYYRTGSGNGNLPDNNVNCLVKDKSSFIWIGTDNGIGVVQCAQNAFKAGSCDAVRPVVQFDNFAGYLFSGQTVQAIAVDGADRKWVGTRDGVWLISADAQKIIYHFTEDSTPLLSNDVREITVDGMSGEVFFSTAKGICCFRGTATEGGKENSNVLVFPNPVPPGYSGTIAVRGLVDNAVVKITELNGRLVYQTNALGGQAVWNGRDYKGRTVSTGVYLVLVSDRARGEKVAAKIVFIGR